MIETIATVEANQEVTAGYRLLSLRFDQDVRCRAGQFAMLKAGSGAEPLLRRALAVYRVEGPRTLTFLYQVLGPGTRALSNVSEGGKVDALAPLGNGWLDSHFGANVISNAPATRNDAIVVAGGIGSASMLMLCEELARRGTDTHLVLGAASESVAVGCGLDDFSELDVPLSITTDDGSLGERGLVTLPLERLLRDKGGNDATIYACGPWKMMKRVAEVARQFASKCLVSLEAPMGCGFGVCVGCVVAVRHEGPLGYESYKRVCTEGPIFDADTIRWEVEAMAH